MCWVHHAPVFRPLLLRLAVPSILAAALFSGSGQTTPLPPPVQRLWAEASAAQNQQQYLRAASLYQQILALRPDLIEAEVNRGLMLHLGGDLPGAVECFEHALQKQPGLFAPNLFAGLDNLKMDNAAKAIPYLERAVRLNPTSIEARLGLANSYLRLDRYSEAVEVYSEAAGMAPGNAEAWYGIGATYLSLEKQEEEALRHSSSPFRAELLGYSYLQQGQVEKSISVLSTVAQGGKVPCAHSVLGLADLQASRFDDAARQFALDWNAKANEGCLLGQLGIVALDAKQAHPNEALEQLNKVVGTDAAFVAANSDVFMGALAAAGSQDAARSLMSRDRQPPGEPRADENPTLAGKRGHYSVCSVSLEKHMQQLDPEHLRLLCRCAFYAGRDPVVMTASRRILQHSAADPEALYWRIQSVERLGLDAIGRAVTLNPESASLHALMGDLLQSKGDYRAAADEYGKAIAIKPEFLSAHLSLARDLNSDHRSAEAEQQIRFVLTASPDDPEANYLMGELLVNRAAFQDALPFLLKALHAAADERPYVHADLSRVYEEEGDLTRAIAEMKQAVSIDVDGSYNYRLGRLYLKIGDRPSAAAALAVAAKLHEQTDAAAIFVK